MTRRTRLLTVIFGIILTCGAFAEQSPDRLNVMDFGAKGDGKADDTAAIAKAIEAGAARKFPVSFPRGEYRVTKPLTIEGQSLMGNEPGAWSSDSGPMPTIHVDHRLGPAIIMKGASSVHGLGFMYDNKTAEKYPPAISLAGVGLSITNVRIAYCTDGIIADGTSNTGRLNIENVFMVSPRNLGLYVTRSYDIPTIRNVEVWNNMHYPGVTAFRFGQVDGMRASQLMAFGVKVGFDLVDDTTGGVWATFDGCGTDACEFGWRAEGEKGHTVGINGGYFWDHFQTFLLKNPNASIRVTGVECQSNGAPVVEATKCRMLIMTGCRIARAFENANVPYFNLQAVDALTVVGCVITSFGPGFVIGAGVKRASITGNVFEPSKLDRILKDERSPDSDIVFADNAGMTPGH